MKKVAIAKLPELEDRKPAYAISGEVDLVVVRIDDAVSVFYGSCLHRGADHLPGQYFRADDTGTGPGAGASRQTGPG